MPRYVRTPEGEKKYGEPIGTLITPDLVAKAKLLKQAQGKNVASGKTAAKVSQGGKVTPTTKITKPAQHGAAAPVGKNHPQAKKAATSQQNLPKPAKPIQAKLKKSDLGGTKHFTVAGSEYSAPDGSRIFQGKNNDKLSYVLTPEGKVHAFIKGGEVDLPESLQVILKNKFSGDLTNDPTFKEIDFEATSSSHDLTTLPTGATLTDPDGKPVFKKLPDGSWESTDLGVAIQEEDIQPLFDKGDLLPEATPEEEPVQEAFKGTEANNFKDMSKADFISTLDAMPAGQKLTLNKGEGAAEATALKNEDGTWSFPDGTKKDGKLPTSDLYPIKSVLSVGEAKQPEPPKSTPLRPPSISQVGKQPTDTWIKKAAPGSAFTMTDDKGEVVTWNKTGPNEWTLGDDPKPYYDDQSMAEALSETPDAGTLAVTKDAPHKPVKQVKDAPPRPKPKVTAESKAMKKLANQKKKDEHAKVKKAAGQEYTDLNEGSVIKNKINGIQFVKKGDSFVATNGSGATLTGDHLKDKPLSYEIVTKAPPPPKFPVGHQLHIDDLEDVPNGLSVNDSGTGHNITKLEDDLWESESGNTLDDSDMKDLLDTGDPFVVVDSGGDDEDVTPEVVEKAEPTPSDEKAHYGKGQPIKDLKETETGDVITVRFDKSVHTHASHPKTSPMTFVKKEDGKWEQIDGPSATGPQNPNSSSFYPNYISLDEHDGVLIEAEGLKVDPGKIPAGAKPMVIEAEIVPSGNFVTVFKGGGEPLTYEKYKENTWVPVDAFMANLGQASLATGLKTDDEIDGYTKQANAAVYVNDPKAVPTGVGIGSVSVADKNLVPNGRTVYAVQSDGSVIKLRRELGGEAYEHNWATEDGEFFDDFESLDSIWMAPQSETVPIGVSLKATKYDDFAPAAELPGTVVTTVNPKKSQGNTNTFRKASQDFWLDSGGASHSDAEVASATDDPDISVWKQPYFMPPEGVPGGSSIITKPDELPLGSHVWVPVTTGPPLHMKKISESGWMEMETGATIADVDLQKESQLWHSPPPSGQDPNELVNSLVKPSEMADFPVGTTVKMPGGSNQYTKLQDGTYLGEHGTIFQAGDIEQPAYDESYVIVGMPDGQFVKPVKPEAVTPPVGHIFHSLKEVHQLPDGSVIAWNDGADVVNIKKDKNGDWRVMDDNGNLGPTYSESDLQDFIDDQDLTFGEYHADNTPDDWEMALMEGAGTTSGGKQLWTGGPVISQGDMKEALDALESHPGFQVKYGLKSVSSGNAFNEKNGLQEKFIEYSSASHPSLKPKQAAIKFLKTWSGQVEAPGSSDTYGPKIHFGSNNPKQKGVQGFDGGDFSSKDVEEAIAILEGYDGKLIKAELNKHGNALGKLDPTKLVGFDKDKLVTKQKIIDLLKTKALAHAANGPDKTPEVEEVFGSSVEGLEQITNEVTMENLLPNSQVVWYNPNSEAGVKIFTKDADGVWVNEATGSKIASLSFGASIDSNNVYLKKIAEPSPAAAPVKTTPEPGSQILDLKVFADLPVGTNIYFYNGMKQDAYIKTGDGVWSGPDGSPYQDFLFKEGVLGAKIYMGSKADAQPKGDDVLTSDGPQSTLVNDGFVLKSSEDLHAFSEGDMITGFYESENGNKHYYFKKNNLSYWENQDDDNEILDGAELLDKYYDVEWTAHSKQETLPTYAQQPAAVQDKVYQTIKPESAPYVAVAASKGSVFKSKYADVDYTLVKNDTDNWTTTVGGQQTGTGFNDKFISGILANGSWHMDNEGDGFSENGLMPGKYSSGKSAYMIVHSDGKGVYVNGKGTVSKLSANAVKKNYDAGMSKYHGVVADVPSAGTNVGPKAKVVSDISDGTYFLGLPSNPKATIYTVKGDKAQIQKPAIKSNKAGYKIGTYADSMWRAEAHVGAVLENDDYGTYPKGKFTKQANGKFVNASGVEFDGTAPYYVYKVAGHGYPTGPQDIDKKKLNTQFSQGQLVDQYGNSVLPEGYSGGLLYFGAPTTAPNLLQAQKEIKNLPDYTNPAAAGILKKHGINHVPELMTKYVNDNYPKPTSDSETHTTGKKALLDSMDSVLSGIDTEPIKGDAAGVFNYDVLGNPIYPADVVGVPTYSITDLNNFIKAASANIGGGKIIGQHYTSMDKNDKAVWVSYFKKGDFASMYKIEVMAAAKKGLPHASGYLHPGYEGNPETNTIAWGPAVPGEIPVSTKIPGSWTEINLAASKEEVDNYLIKAQMQYPTYLNLAEKRMWVKHHRNGNQQDVNLLSVSAQNRKNEGTTPLSDPPVWTDDVTAAKVYDPLFDSSKFPTTGWNYTNAVAYYNDHSDDPKLADQYKSIKYLEPTNPEDWLKLTAVQNHFQQLLDDFEAEKLKPVYTKSASKQVVHSTHPVYPYVDQFGNDYYFKHAPGGDPYRSEAEHAGNQLGKLFGFDTADSKLVTLDGAYGQLQQDLGGVGDLMNFDYKTLTVDQIADIGMEHVLDHFLDNDDAKGDNVKILANGHIVGIDKGRAFKHYIHWNSLSANEELNTNAVTIYSQLYDKVRSGAYKKVDLDKAYLKIRARANKMSKVPDELVTDILKEGMKNRSVWEITYSIDGTPVSNDYAGLEAAALDRKSKLVADFDKMWAQLYKDAGIGDLPEPPKNPLGDVLSGLDDERLHEQVYTVNAAGKSTVVGGSGASIIGGTVTMWSEEDSDGSTSVYGQMYTGPKKQEELITYFNQYVDPAKGGGTPDAFTFDIYGTPFINAAKTVNHHAADGEYNQGTLNNFDTYHKQLMQELGEWNAAMVSNTDQQGNAAYKFSTGTIIPMEHLEQYKLMLDHYASIATKINYAKSIQGKTDPHHFEAYSPHKLDPAGEKWIKGNQSYTRVGTVSAYTFLYNDGKTITLVKNPDPQKLGFTKVVPDKKETPKSNVSVKLNKTTFERTTSASGKLGNHKKASDTHVSVGAAGQEYEIELPTGEKIYWRNSHVTGTARGQTGKLSFRVPQTDDPAKLSLSMERIQQQLEVMGFDMSPADHTHAELIYWREMYGILENRSHTTGGITETNKKHAAAYKKMKLKVNELGGDEEKFLENLSGSMSPDAEVQYWRELYSEFWPAEVKKLIASEGYLPKYDHQNLEHPELETGLPYWERFDTDKKAIVNSGVLIITNSGGEPGDKGEIESGGLISGEERIRQMGKIHTGGEYGQGSALQDQGNGSSHQIYTRIRTEKSLGSHGYSYILHPGLLSRTRTYSLASDSYGNLQSRKSGSPSDPLAMISAFSGASNNDETMTPNLASVLDSMELFIFDDYSKRDKYIQKLKKLGFAEIRGVKVEDRLVMRNDLSAAIAKIRKQWLQELS